MVRVRYVGTLFELNIPDFLHIAPAFCMQRQKTAEAEVKCLNWDRWFKGKWFQSQLKLRVVKSKDGSTVRYTVRKYGTPQFLLRSTVRWYMVRLFCNGTGTVCWYGMVQGARYVVRKFCTYRTVLPSLFSIIVCSAHLKLRLCKNLYSKTCLNSEICVRFSSNQFVVALYYFQFLVVEFVFAL